LTGRQPKNVPVLLADNAFARKLYWNIRIVDRTLHELLAMTVTLHRSGMLFLAPSGGGIEVSGEHA